MASLSVSPPAAPARPAWRDWRRWRNALFADPRFITAATRFPLTRLVARRRTRALFDLCAGFVYSQVLFACVELRLFETLVQGPLHRDEIAARIGLPVVAAERLLLAARSLDLVERRHNDAYELGPYGALLIGNPGIAAMVQHHALLYRDLADPVALLRGTAGSSRLARFWPYAAADRDDLSATEVAPYSALMAASQAFVAREILAVYPLRRHRCLLDVGGGEGAFLEAAAQRAKHLRLMLFDLPAVVARAEARMMQAGLAARCALVGGDFTADPLPQGADVISLVRVIHDHDDATALGILRAARRALPADGTLLLAEPMAETHGAEPAGDAYFGLYLLAMGRGRPRTAKALGALLGEAGFSRQHEAPTATPLLVRVIVGKA